MEVDVRFADRGSAAELTALHRAAAHTAYAHIFPPDAPPPTYEEDLARWEHWLGPDWNAGRRAYVAITGGGATTARPIAGVVGVVLAGPDPEDPAIGHLSRLYVHPRCWGHGIGTRLHDEAVRDLVRRRFPEATLWVLEANTRARGWYERLGWRPTGHRKPVYAPAAIDELHYHLPLA